MGIKPLYWTRQNGSVRVRVRTQGAARGARASPSRSIRKRVASYLRHACVPAPRAIYREVRKLDARRAARGDGARRDRDIATGTLPAVARRGQARTRPATRVEIVDELDGLLADAVQAADGVGRAARRVPVGRHQFLDGRRADAAGRGRPRQDLLDRVSRGRLQRGRPCARRSRSISAPIIPN